MFIVFYILCGTVGILFGLVLAKVKEPKCNHKWELIKSNSILRGELERHVGWINVYECEHCKKMKKEQVEID
jgi:hypothetical protein